LAVSAVAYDVLRAAGAVYLVYQGFQMRRREHRFEVPSGPLDDKGAHRWFWRGLLANLLNPKVGVFYVTRRHYLADPPDHRRPSSPLMAFARFGRSGSRLRHR
jgi:threonine/homoserine/homoserine lactone efflux protein